jgi:hypothetical protein
LVSNGEYNVTVCVGDAGFEQIGQRVEVEGQVLIDDRTTGLGEFRESSAMITVKDGRLTVELGLPGRKQNTCLYWLRIARLQAKPTP